MKWFVIHTKPRFEKKVEEKLLSFGIEAYCPTRKEIRLWSDRKKKVDIPVLPSMVLVRIKEQDVNDVFNINGVIRYMFWLGKRAIVRQSEIDILKKYLDRSYNPVISKSSLINVGDNFDMSSFNNEKGIVNKISNNNIWIYLRSIGCTVKLNLA
jgi:transcription antitermination factor NusG